MKQFLFRSLLAIFLFCGLAASVEAQTYYRCTGNNVNVRKGPGKNYAVLLYEYAGFSQKQQISKGCVVKFLGQKKNGFMHVEDAYPWQRTTFGQGWVSAQYLVPATKCTNCKGKGRLDEICPECNGDICPMYNIGACDDGYVRCQECFGAGYK